MGQTSKWIGGLFGLMTLCFSGGAFAAPDLPPPPPPPWVQWPLEDLPGVHDADEDYFPPEALAKGETDSVGMICEVEAGNLLSNCRPEYAKAENTVFVAAAVKIMARKKAADPVSLSVDGKARFIVEFRIDRDTGKPRIRYQVMTLLSITR